MNANHTAGRRAQRTETAIAALAKETRTDEAVVKSLYQEEVATLEAQSSVKAFIGVIAARRVKKRLSSPHEQDRSPKPRGPSEAAAS